MFSFLFVSALFFSASLACDKGFCISSEICSKLTRFVASESSTDCAGSRVCCQATIKTSTEKRQLPGLIGGLLGGGGGGGMAAGYGDLIDKAMTLAGFADKLGVDVPPELTGALEAAKIANDLVTMGAPMDLAGFIDVGKMIADAAGKITGGAGSGDLVGQIAGKAAMAAGGLLPDGFPDIGQFLPDGMGGTFDPTDLLPNGSPNLPNIDPMAVDDAKQMAADILAEARANAAKLQAEAELLKEQARQFLLNPNNFAKNDKGEFINQEGQPVDKFGQLLYPPALPANNGGQQAEPNNGAGRDILPEDNGNGGFMKNNGFDEFNRGDPDAINDGDDNAADDDNGEDGLDRNAIVAIVVVGAIFCCLIMVLVFCLVSKNDSMHEEYGVNVHNQFYDPHVSARQWSANPPIGPDTMPINQQPSYSARQRSNLTGNIPSPGANLRQPYNAGRDRFTTAIDVPVAPNYGGTVGSQWGEGKFACRTCGKKYHYQSDQQAHQQKNNH